MKNKKVVSLFICLFLILIPLQRAKADPTSWASLGFTALNLLMMSNPLILTGGLLSGSIAFIFVVYNSGKIVVHVAPAIAPYPILFSSQKFIAQEAIKQDLPQLFDLMVTVNEYCRQLSYIGSFCPPKLLEEGQFHEIVAEGKKVSHVIIQRAGTLNLDINGQFGSLKEVPLSLALKFKHYKIVQDLLQNEVDLRQRGNIELSQNLFFDVIQTGVRKFIDLSLKESSLTKDTVDAKGNSLLHLASSNPELWKMIQNLEFSSQSFSQKNRKGETAFDLLFDSYFKSVTDLDTILTYLSKVESIEKHDVNLFSRMVENETLRKNGVPLLWLEKGAVLIDSYDAFGRTPLDLAIEKRDEKLAFELATRIQVPLQRQLAHALFSGLIETTKILGARLHIFSDTQDSRALLSFYLNPFDDGRSILAYMVEEEKYFNESVFHNVYHFLKENVPGTNPLEFQTKYFGNLLETAALLKNSKAVTCILRLIEEEGWMKHLSVLTANSHSVVPALIQEGFGYVLKETLFIDSETVNVAQNLLLSAAIQEGKIEAQRFPLLIEAESSEKNSLVLYNEKTLVAKLLPGEGVLVSVSPQFKSSQNKKIAQINEMLLYRSDEKRRQHECISKVFEESYSSGEIIEFKDIENANLDLFPKQWNNEEIVAFYIPSVFLRASLILALKRNPLAFSSFLLPTMVTLLVDLGVITPMLSDEAKERLWVQYETGYEALEEESKKLFNLVSGSFHNLLVMVNSSMTSPSTVLNSALARRGLPSWP